MKLVTYRLVSSRIATLAGQVGALRSGLPQHERAAAESLLLPVQGAARHAATVNATLLKQAGALRTLLGQQIDLLRRDHEAATAYHATPARVPGLDEVR